MDEYETKAKYNIAETCCASLSIAELASLSDNKEVKASDIIDLSMIQDYGEIQGNSELRNNLSRLYSSKVGTPLSPDNILITSVSRPIAAPYRNHPRAPLRVPLRALRFLFAFRSRTFFIWLFCYIYIFSRLEAVTDHLIFDGSGSHRSKPSGALFSGRAGRPYHLSLPNIPTTLLCPGHSRRKGRPLAIQPR